MHMNHLHLPLHLHQYLCKCGIIVGLPPMADIGRVAHPYKNIEKKNLAYNFLAFYTPAPTPSSPFFFFYETSVLPFLFLKLLKALVAEHEEIHHQYVMYLVVEGLQARKI